MNMVFNVAGMLAKLIFMFFQAQDSSPACTSSAFVSWICICYGLLRCAVHFNNFEVLKKVQIITCRFAGVRLRVTGSSRGNAGCPRQRCNDFAPRPATGSARLRCPSDAILLTDDTEFRRGCKHLLMLGMGALENTCMSLVEVINWSKRLVILPPAE